MSMGEILVILVVAILVLGPDKLPDTIVQIAKFWKALKRNIDNAKSSIEKEIRINELKNETKKYQDEFSSANENIRKKLSFEEFDVLKKDILEDKKVDLTFGSTSDLYENLEESKEDLTKESEVKITKENLSKETKINENQNVQDSQENKTQISNQNLRNLNEQEAKISNQNAQNSNEQSSKIQKEEKQNV